MDISAVRRMASPAVNNLIIDHTATTRPEYVDAVRVILYPPRRPQPMNIDLCSSCEHGTHNLCTCRLGGVTWPPTWECRCLCQYADHAQPARRPSQLFSESPLDPALPDADLDASAPAVSA